MLFSIGVEADDPALPQLLGNLAVQTLALDLELAQIAIESEDEIRRLTVMAADRQPRLERSDDSLPRPRRNSKPSSIADRKVSPCSP